MDILLKTVVNKGLVENQTTRTHGVVVPTSYTC